jgi:putative membrane-bound dehydrogenase-like protein
MNCYPIVCFKAFLIFGVLVERSIGLGQDFPLSPSEAVASMKVPEGFQVSLFAAEPDVRQPIGFCIDDRGRLWVAEAYNYPKHGTNPGDRIVIFDDVDNDGTFDKRTIFYDKLNYVTGIEVGFGGAWVMSPPYFYFIPDRNGDDVPDSEPEILLDGFGNHANSHNLANGFAWGPDGWLYGTHGRTNWSKIGKPGVDDQQRLQFDGGVYRYHPTRHIWEPYADGTTNPWGIDWNSVGEAFVCNCVNPHLFHVLQGAHYEPWRNRESSRFAFQRIDTIADHLHYTGTSNVRDGLGSAAEDVAGGGHAHCGTMIYLGDNWPTKYRDSVFMNNIHGKRINHDWLRSEGSGYVASHAPDILRSQDPWHMGVTLQYGPDGGVYILDWSDTGECHSVKNTQRETGRIFKITYGKPTKPSIDLAKASNDELADLQKHPNEWWARHARRLLQERSSSQSMAPTASILQTQFNESNSASQKLRALWTLYCTGQTDVAFLRAQCKHRDEHIRTWAIRLLGDSMPRKELAAILEPLSIDESSPKVRLYLAVALQRIACEDRWEIAENLVQVGKDAADHNIPLMLWYGIEPLIDHNAARYAQLALLSKIPIVQEHAARRIGGHDRWEVSEAACNQLFQSLAVSSSTSQINIIKGLLSGLEGRRQLKTPHAWNHCFQQLKVIDNEQVRDLAMRLGVAFDDPLAMDAMIVLVNDSAQNTKRRELAIQTLLAKKPTQLVNSLFGLIDKNELRTVAVQSLAEFDQPDTPAQLLGRYARFDDASRRAVVQTLSSRSAWGSQLLDALESGLVSRRDISAYDARQLLNLKSDEIEKRLLTLWGDVRPTATSKSGLVNKLKKQLSDLELSKSNATLGKAVFSKACAQCHRLFGEGGTIGPDLAGSQRTNLDYLLENIIDPSASVSKDFLTEKFLLDGGRVVTGIVLDESDFAITVQTATEKLALPKSDVEERQPSKSSMMPEGLLENLSKSQISGLFAYIMERGAKEPAALGQ